jgi:hypothetical protein
MFKDQSQEVGEGGTAIQAAGSVNFNVGITYSEARQIAQDMAKAVFSELTGIAKETANLRVDEITEKVILKLQNEYPAGLQKAVDPDFQYALLTVQKEYARNADEDLGDLLVDLLVDRSKQEKRNILQIVLNESLATAPKLTEGQLGTLALVFLLRYTRNNNILNEESFSKYLDQHVQPFIDKVSNNKSSFQHLEFCSCGSTSVASSVNLAIVFRHSYTALFFKGFEEQEISNIGLTIGKDNRFFMPCINDATKFQLRAVNKDALDYEIKDKSISSEDAERLAALFNTGLMDENEIKQKVISISPYMSQIFLLWDSSDMKSFNLTSVGMAIGHANTKRLIGEFADLSIWIN